MTWRQDWVSKKSEIARRLSRGEIGGGYGEAVIVVSAVISALAAERWPGTKIDRKRFVELLTQYGSEREFLKTISVPLLLQELQSIGATTEVDSIANSLSLSQKSLVVTGIDVDKTEAELLLAYPNCDVQFLRRFSYASLLYKEIRSSYAHEYRPGASADSAPMTRMREQKVSYVNMMSDDGSTRRLIHFHLDYLLQIPTDLAIAMDRMDSTVPISQPTKWWLDGGQ